MTNETVNQLTKEVTVTMSNALLRSKQDLSVIEIRVMRYLIHRSRETESGFEDDKPLIVEINHYRKLFESDDDSGALYMRFRRACTALMRTQFFQFMRESDGTSNEAIYNWITGLKFHPESGKVQIILNPTLKQEIWRLTENFTSYDLLQLGKLRSAHSSRLYEYLMSFKGAGTCGVDIQKLRSLLNAPENQPTGDFTRRLVKQTVKEINAKTDINAKITQKKKGRLIIGYTFTIIKNEGQPVRRKRSSAKKRAPEIDAPLHPSHLPIADAVRNAELAKIRKQLKIAPREESLV